MTNSVAVIIVRKGNPKHITGWNDLIKPGIGVVTPNPFTSGSARWNIMAAYGAQLREGKTPAQAEEYLKKMFHNVVSQDSSARNALQTFLAGKGDALIDYEDEAIADQKKGSPIEYIIPSATILIQNPIAVTKQGNTAVAQKFVNYLLSPAGQQIWVEKGYRPVIAGVPGAEKFPTPKNLFTIEQLGGWKAVTKQFFEPETGVVTKIEQSLESPLPSSPPPPWRCRASRAAGDSPLLAGGPPASENPVRAGSRRALGVAARPRAAGIYLSVLVLLPLAALLAKSTKGGTGAFWREVSNPEAVAAIKLTLIVSAIVVLINAVFGTLIAWVMVRDEFPGKRMVNAMIDLPFALPTIVAGVVLLALYGKGGPVGIDITFTRAAIGLALLFVTLPFVTRSVQPVLLELDGSMEEAAASLGAGRITIFRRIVLPTLAPAIISGIALSFARAVGEFGSIVLISGNLPFKTEVGSVYIFSQIQNENLPAAAAVSIVLLVSALVVLAALSLFSRTQSRYV